MAQKTPDNLAELFEQWEYERIRNNWIKLAELYNGAASNFLIKENPFLKLIPSTNSGGIPSIPIKTPLKSKK